MFKGGNPLEKGSPNDSDIPIIKEFVALSLERAENKMELKKIPGIMKYFSFLSPPSIGSKIMPGIKFSPELCKGCSKCVDACPVNNIILLNNIAHHNDNCIKCYRCVEVCSFSATDAKLISVEKPLRAISFLPENSSEVC
jgi:ferredoxin